MGITTADIKEIDMINRKLATLSPIICNIINGSMKRNSDIIDNGINIQTKIIPASIAYKYFVNTSLK
mgnify:CR=1 FL=1